MMVKLGGNLYNHELDQIRVLCYSGHPRLLFQGIFTGTVRKFQVDNDFSRGIAIASMDQ
jgi:hypothetical protein